MSKKYLQNVYLFTFQLQVFGLKAMTCIDFSDLLRLFWRLYT